MLKSTKVLCEKDLCMIALPYCTSLSTLQKQLPETGYWARQTLNVTQKSSYHQTKKCVKKLKHLNMQDDIQIHAEVTA